MRKLYAIPTVATLYLFIVIFPFIFLSPEILKSFMLDNSPMGTTVFFAIVLSLAGLSFLCGIIGIISGIVCFLRGDDSLAMAKTAMIVKLCLIPAYIILLGLGFIFFCGGVFTLAFLVATIVADYCVLLITGFFNTLAIIRAVHEGKISFKGNRRYILLQLIYCADVVASILFFRKLKKLYSEEPHPTVK